MSWYLFALIYLYSSGVPQTSECGYVDISQWQHLLQEGSSVKRMPTDDYQLLAVDDFLSSYQMTGDTEGWFFPTDTRQPQLEPRQQLIQLFYEQHADVFDWIVILSDFEYIEQPVVAFYLPVSNDTSGIGLAPFDFSYDFGSAGRLKGIIELGNYHKYLNESRVDHQHLSHVLLHEIGHTWLARASYLQDDTIHYDLLSSDRNHWSFLLDTDGSHMYGNDWSQNNIRNFQSGLDRFRFSALDLYLMGMKSSADVPPLKLLRNSEYSPDLPPMSGATIEAETQTITIQQLQGAMGTRQPAFDGNAQSFRIGVIYLSASGIQLDQPIKESFRQSFQDTAERFQHQTEAMGYLDIRSAPRVVRSGAPDITQGLAFLNSKQQTLWQDHSASQIRDSVAAIRARSRHGLEVASELQELSQWQDRHLDDTARILGLLGEHLISDTVRHEHLLAAQHSNGGFALNTENQPSLVDTALALDALRYFDTAPTIEACQSAIDFLLTRQSASGNWGSVFETATVVSALAHAQCFDADTQAPVLSRALTWLRLWQGQHGGYGETDVDIANSATVLLALAALGESDPLAAGFLHQTQHVDGSWNNKVLPTALALQFLAIDDVANATDLALRVSDVTFSTPHWNPGTLLQIEARVRNQGPLTAENPRLVLEYEQDGSFHEIATLTADAPLQANNSWLAQYDWLIPTDLFTFDLHIRTISDTTDLDPGNNRTRFSYRPSNLAPDVAVLHEETRFSQTTPFIGETLTLSTMIRNLGQQPATDVTLEWFEGTPETGRLLANLAIPSLSGGMETAASMTWQVDGSAGRRVFTLQVSAEADQQSSNNLWRSELTILEAVQGDDLGVHPFATTIEPNTFDTAPQTFSVQTVVVDHGQTQPGDAEVRLYRGPPENQALLTSQPVTFSSSEMPITLTGTLDYLGDQDLYVEITSPSISDVRPENNLYRLFVPGNHLEDLELVANSLNASDLFIDQTATFQANAINRQYRALTDIDVVWEVDRGEGFQVIQQQKVDLPGATTTPLTAEWQVTEPAESVTFRVRIDPNNLIDEVDEDDNTLVSNLTIARDPEPNVLFPQNAIQLGPAPYREGETLDVAVQFQNGGGATAEQVIVSLHFEDPNREAIATSTPLSQLQAGETQTVNLQINPLAVRGDQLLFAVVEATQESRADDNQTVLPIYVSGGPNPTFQSNAIQLNPSWPGENETVQVTVFLRNEGAQTAENLHVALHQNQTDGMVLAQTHLDLAPGTEEVQFQFEAQGELTGLYAVLDGSNDIVEQVETDNISYIGITLRNGDFATNEPLISPNGDGIKDQTTIFWSRTEPHITLEIQDAFGEVHRRWSQRGNTGSVIWDGRKQDGELCEDGPYIARLRDGDSGFLLKEMTITVDNNRLKFRDVLNNPKPGFVNQLNPDVAVDGDWLGWAKDGSRAIAVAPSGPPIMVTPDGSSAQMMSLYARKTWTFAGLPGRYLFQGDANFDDPSSYYLVRADGSFETTFYVDYWSGEQVLDWIAPTVVLVQTQGTPYLIRYDFATDTRTPIDPSEGTWQEITDGFRYGDFIYLLHLGGQNSAPTGVYRVSVAGGLAQSLFELPDTFQTARPDTIAQHQNYWSISAREYDGAPIDDVIFIDLDQDEMVTWDSLHPGVKPISDGFFSDARLYVHPTADVPPGSLLIQDWVSGSQYFIDQATADLLKGFVSSDEVRILAYGPTLDLGIMSAPQNLGIVFEAILTGNGGVHLTGTATDKFLQDWEIEYAAIQAPDQWQSTGLSGTFSVVNGNFGYWIPEDPGAYVLRLTARDHAGNQRQRHALVTIEGQRPFYGLSQDHSLFSPNRDGFLEAVTLSFQAREPFQAEVLIYDHHGVPVQRISETIVATGPTTLTWDGSGESGTVLPDGSYTLDFDGLHIPVELDTSAPQLEFVVGQPYRDDVSTVQADSLERLTAQMVCDVAYGIQDLNLDYWVLERSPDNGTTWLEIKRDVVSFETPDLLPEQFNLLDHVLHQRFRIRATDRAGNSATLQQTPLIDNGIWTMLEQQTLKDGEHKLLLSSDLTDPQSQPAPVRTLARDQLANLTWLAAMPQAAFPITLEQLLVRPLHESAAQSLTPDANQLVFDQTILQPGLNEQQLPSGTIYLQLQFRDALGQIHLSEVIERQDIQLQVDLLSLTPLSNGNARVVYQVLQRRGGVATQSMMPISADMIGVIGGITLPTPVYLSPTDWKSHVEACSQYGRQIVRLELPSSVWQSGQAMEGSFRFEHVRLEREPVSLELDSMQSGTFCSGSAEVTLVPQFVSCQDTYFEFKPFVEGTLPDNNWEIQFFADLAATRTLSSSLNLVAMQNTNASIRFDRALLSEGSSPDIYVWLRHPERDGGISQVSQTGLQIRFSLEFDTPSGNMNLASLPLDVTPLVPSIPDQIICEVPFDQQSQTTTTRAVQFQLERLPSGQYGGANQLPFAPIRALRALPNGNADLAVSLEIDLLTSDLNRGTLSFFTRPLYRSGSLSKDWLLEVTFVNEIGACEIAQGWITLAENADGTSLQAVIESSNRQAQFLASPNGDFVDDEILVPFRLGSQASVSVWAESVAGVPIKLLRDGNQLQAGLHYFHWDGQNQQGQLMADGLYQIRIVVRSFCGQTIERIQRVSLDTEAPNVVVEEPLAGAVQLPQPIVLSASDTRGLDEITITLTPTDNPSDRVLLFQRKATSAILANLTNATLAWLQARQAGEHELLVVVTDRVGNQTQVTRLLDISPAPLLASLELSSPWISPNADGRFDQLQLQYALHQQATVQLHIGGNGTDAVLFEAERTSGQHLYVFDGRVGGNLLSEGTYTLSLSATTQLGVDQMQMPIRIDRTAPSLAITSPTEGRITAQQQLEIQGSINPGTGTPLAWWKLWQRGNTQASSLIAEGTTEPQTAVLGEALKGRNGNVELELQAQDAAGNQITLVRSYVLDTEAPQLQWTTPQAKQVFSAEELIALNGTFVEANPNQLNLAWLDGDTPQHIAQFEEPDLASDHFSSTWDPQALPDGWYTLRATMRDDVAHETVADLEIGLDNAAPIVALDPLPNQGVIANPTDIQGTVTDLSLQSYELSLVYVGPRKRNDGFVPLFRGTQPINNDVLFSWRVLPPDGQYQLRLRATDAVGRSSETTQTLYVDRTAPEPANSLTLDVENKGVAPSRYADVTLIWDASVAGDVHQYEVLRNGQVLATIPSATLTYTDTFLADGNYLYEVVAIDLAGNRSETSAIIETLVDSTAPTPYIFHPPANRQLGGMIDVTASVYDLRLAQWTLSLGQGQDPTAWVALATGTQNVSFDTLYQWLASADTPGWYTLRLRASDTYGNTNEHRVSFEVVNQVPGRPDPPSVQATASGLQVSWSHHPDGNIQHYRIFRDGVLLGTFQATTYLDDVPDGIYSYQITAVNYFGLESPLSSASPDTQIDRNSPHVSWVTPIQDTRFESELNLQVFTPDRDIAAVQFEYRPASETLWTLIASDATAPWQTQWVPALPDGSYELRAIASEILSGETDPNPTIITVHKGDTTPPVAPVLDQTQQDEDRVTLNWSIVDDAASYRVYLLDQMVEEVTAPDTNTTLEGLSAGDYQVHITALDAAGNESLASNTRSYALVGPFLSESNHLTLDGQIQLSGIAPQNYDTVTVFLNASQLDSLPTDGDGQFNGVVQLDQPVETNLTVFAIHASGWRSLPTEIYVNYPEAQPSPTNFTVESDQQQPESAVLQWTAPNPQPIGYWVQRDGVTTNEPTLLNNWTVTSIPQSENLSWLHDERDDTSWQPGHANEQVVICELPQVEAITGLGFNWQTQHPIPTQIHLEARIDGQFYAVDTLQPDQLAEWQHVFDETLVTDQLRFTFEEGSFSIRELQLHHRPLLARGAETVTDVEPGNGAFTYDLEAVDVYGRIATVGPRTVIIGDPVPPEPASALSAQVSGNHVTLTWQASPSDDVAAYRLVRNQRLLVDTSDLEWQDANLLNGHYSYQVFALDTAGNLSTASNTVDVDIQAGLAPPQLTVQDQGDGSLWLNWSFTGTQAEYRGFVLERRVSNNAEWDQIYPSYGVTGERTYQDRAFPDLQQQISYRVGLVDNADRTTYSETVTMMPPLALPVLAFPSVSGSQLDIYRDHVNLAGQAQAGAKVEVQLSDGRGWHIPAQSFQSTEILFETNSEPLALALSPNRRYLVGSYLLQRGWWIYDRDHDQVETLNTLNRAYDLTIDPSGQWVAYVDRTSDSGGFLILVNLETLEAVVPDPATSVTGPLLWAKDETLFYTAGSQLKTYNLFEDRVDATATLPHDIQYLARDHQTQATLLVTEQAWFRLTDDGNRLFEIGAHPGSGVPLWHPQTRACLHIADDGSVSKVRLNQAGLFDSGSFLTFAQLPADTHLLAINPRNDQWLLTLADGSVAWVRPWQLNQAQTTFPVQDRHYASGWTSRGTLLGAQYDGQFVIQEWQPAGYFELAISDLAIGPHQLRINAQDMQQSSRQSATKLLEINHAVTYYANLSVTQADLGAIPAAVVTGNPITLFANVYNLGGAVATGAEVTWQIWDEQDQLLQTSIQRPEPLEIGAVQTLGLDLDTQDWQAGRYRFQVDLNLPGASERNLADNSATGTFVLTQTTGLDLRLQAEQQAVQPGEGFSGEWSLTNIGAPLAEMTLTISLETLAGRQLESLEFPVPQLGNAASILEMWHFDLTNRLAGDYRVRCQIVDANDQQLAEQAITLHYVGEHRVLLNLEGVAAVWQQHQPLPLELVFQNQSRNLAYNQLGWQIQVLNPLGEAVRNLQGQWQQVLPGGQLTQPLQLTFSALATGNYRIVGTLNQANGDLLAQTSQTLEIVATPRYEVLANLYVSPKENSVGIPFKATATLNNSGNQFVDLTAWFSLDDEADQRLQSVRWDLSLAPGESATRDVYFETESMANGDYRIQFTSDAHPQIQLEETRRVRLNRDLPPVVTITGLPEFGHATEPVTLTIDVQDEDDPLPVPILLLNGSPFVSGTTLTEEDRYQLYYYVADSAGNVSEDTIDFAYDGTPPSIQVTNIVDGGSIDLGTIPEIVVQDRHQANVFAYLDGEPINVGVEGIVDPGHHELRIHATDAFFQLNEFVLNFFADDPAENLIVLDGATMNAAYRQARTISYSLAESATLNTLLLNGESITAPFTLSEAGSYQVQATAQRGSRTQTVNLHFELDYTAPEITIEGVTEGAFYPESVRPTVLVDGQEPDDALVSTSLNGVPYQPGTAINEAGSYRLHIQAQDAAGNSSTASTNFTLDLTAPVIQVAGVADGVTYSEPVVITWQFEDDWLAETQALLNGQTVSMPLSPTISGSYELILTARDQAGNQTTRRFQFQYLGQQPLIDISGISEGAVVMGPVLPVIEITGEEPLQTDVQLNQTPWDGQPIAEEGAYTLSVSVTAANGLQAQAQRSFHIDQTAPHIEIQGVADGETYPDAVTPIITIDDPHLTSAQIDLNGAPFQSGTVITQQGAYRLQIDAIDQAGNQSQQSLTFTISEFQPLAIEISGVAAGEHYARSVTPVVSFVGHPIDQQQITIDGAAFISGTPINAEGAHLLRAEASNDNQAVTLEVPFVLDFTAPEITVSGVQQGGVYQTAVTPHINISDSNLASQSVNLNGFPFASGDVIATSGIYELLVEARDRAGNHARFTASFEIDLPQVLTLAPNPLLFREPGVQQVEIFNTGSEMVRLQVSSNSHPDVFELAQTDEVIIQPQSQAQIEIRFDGDPDQTYQALLSWQTNLPHQPELDLICLAAPINQEMVVHSQQVYVQPLLIGSQKLVHIDLDYFGEQSQTVTASVLGSGFELQQDHSFTLAPSSRTQIPILFQPDHAGSHLAQLVVNSQSESLEITLHGVGLKHSDMSAQPLESSPRVVTTKVHDGMLYGHDGQRVFKLQNSQLHEMLNVGMMQRLINFWPTPDAGYYLSGEPFGLAYVDALGTWNSISEKVFERGFLQTATLELVVLSGPDKVQIIKTNGKQSTRTINGVGNIREITALNEATWMILSDQGLFAFDAQQDTVTQWAPLEDIRTATHMTCASQQVWLADPSHIWRYAEPMAKNTVYTTQAGIRSMAHTGTALYIQTQISPEPQAILDEGSADIWPNTITSLRLTTAYADTVFGLSWEDRTTLYAFNKENPQGVIVLKHLQLADAVAINRMSVDDVTQLVFLLKDGSLRYWNRRDRALRHLADTGLLHGSAVWWQSGQLHLLAGTQYQVRNTEGDLLATHQLAQHMIDGTSLTNGETYFLSKTGRVFAFDSNTGSQALSLPIQPDHISCFADKLYLSQKGQLFQWHQGQLTRLLDASPLMTGRILNGDEQLWYHDLYRHQLWHIPKRWPTLSQWTSASRNATQTRYDIRNVIQTLEASALTIEEVTP